MIPILYKKDEVNFTSNGLGRLIDIIDMEVTEELNAQYTIEFTYPIEGRLFNYMIENGGVVFITHDDKGDFQAFDITGHTTTLDGVVVFRGEHIRYRLKNYVVKPFTATSCAQAGMRIMNNCMPQNNPFSFWTDKSSTGNFNLEVPQVAVSLLGGVEGSLLDVYGHGEYVFDMFDVKLYESRGIETGATIRYGKNLLSLNREYDDSDSYSAVAPFWSKDGVTVFTPDLYVASDYAPTEDAVWTTQDDAPITDNNAQDIVFRYRKIIPRPLDLTEAFEEPPTEDQLIYAAKNYLQRNRPWLPDENVEIDFVALWQTDEYESVASLQRLSLGDKVSVYYPEVNLIYENRQVIRVVYDPLNERYKSMELGKPKASLSEAVMDSSENDIRDIVNDAIGKSSAMEQAIAHATQLITGGLGGHVVLKMNAQGEPEEFLIMDTDDINTAVNVWRWNMGGLGHSHNGYNGPYSDVALTMDGRINANMITTGLLNAELIKAGVLSDEAGRNYWNMVTGEFSLQGYATETYADLVGTNANSYTDQVFSESISEVDVEYAKNSSSSTAPTSGWSTNAPVWEDGKYIWTRTKTVSDGQTYYSDPVCITGAKGETGQQGQTGAGVSAIVEQYYLSTSSTTQTGGSWSTNQPAWASGKYIWTRSKITWTGGSTTYTDPVLAKAINGANQSAKDANDSVTALDESLNQQAIFNRLTNNGQTQGIYLQNGKIYINGTYIQAGTMSANRISGGTLTLGGSNNTNGVWKVNDANGNEIARGDKDGITSKALTATDYIYLNGGLGSYLRIPLGNSVDEFLKIEPSIIPFIIQTKSGNDIRKCSVSVDGIGFYDNNGNTGCSMSIGMYGNESQFRSWGYDSADASDCETRLGINEFVMHDKNDGTSIPPFHIDLDYDYPYLRFYDRKRDQNILHIYYGRVGSNRAFELAFGENLVYSPLKGLIVTAGNVIVRDSSNNMIAKIGKSASTGSPELQLGGTTLSETQLQRLLALVQ